MRNYILSKCLLKKTAIAVALELIIIQTGTAYAVSTEYSTNNIFKVNFYDKGEKIPDGEMLADPGSYGTSVSTRNVTQYQTQIMRGINFWDEIFSSKGVKNSNALLAIFGYEDKNAAGYSPSNGAPGQEYVRSALQDPIITGDVNNVYSYYGSGNLTWYNDPYISVISPNHDGLSIFATSVHELAHDLGMSAGSDEYSSTFQSHFYGKLSNTEGAPFVRITPENYNQIIVGKGGLSGVYFRGEHVSEVLNGALDNQVPINGKEKTDQNEFSHIELQNSFLSHQNWRNYNNLMEAEMAIFQDIGYKIDRRQFYGYSEYGDNQTYVNTHPFYARNDAGTAYITGKPNTATMGVGFHIYGSTNNIIQAADLLADGEGGVGIRIDGTSNKITVANGTRVTANGDHGNGILVAYGNSHHVINKGSISATGNGGVAVRFDFGGNIIGDDKEYRGSYMRTLKGVNADIDGFVAEDHDPYSLNLKGPLASAFDLFGSLEGSYASIYIAKNAYVNKINVLNGASIRGDIISDWDPNNTLIQGSPADTYTHLNFGVEVDDEGNVAGSDSSFAMTLYGSIQGYESLKVNHAAGTLNINGTVEAYDLTNSGYLAIKCSEDKYSAQIKTDFTTTGTLETGFYADNTSDKIKVGSEADVSGKWVLRPNRDFYSNNAQISPEFPVVANSWDHDSFDSVDIVGAFSPTLKMRLTNTSVSTPEVAMYRDSDAYSKYAESGADSEVGSALYGIASEAHGDMQELIASLDFSDLQGKSVTSALKQLGPSAFDYGTMTALRDSTAVTGEMMRHMHGTMLSSRYNNLYNSDTLMASNSYDLNSGIKGVSDRKIIGFVIPYGDFTKQSGTNGLDNMRSYSGGVVMGAECVRNDGVTYGIHGGLSIRNTKVKSENISKIDSQGLFVGLHGSISPEDWGGYYAEGQVKAGWYENQSKRYIDFNNYSQKAKGDYSTYSTGLSLCGGYDFTYGTLSFGPMAYTEYNFIHNQGFTEKRGGGTNLKVKSTNANSLQTTLGGHLLKMWSPSQEIGITADFRTGLKHEFLDDKFHTRASFSDYGSYSFESYTKGAGRNSIFCQSELTLDNRKYNMFASLTLGYEHHNNADIYNVGIKAGLRF
ncbi:autotransporter outer membrane beta-barrel domain-containing protein [Succinivibrio dextrinosolvens]|uniref:autotransporter outer membrane beta-barrel domain-containing protein n=1 Tax=Succinivibrio dextrinosolvens TaxID=83771 RepID=UPI001921E436|nr:autotransporter outer membrane beta-barrel domain-containing protein [Succinivibrio dextrinosolvens]